MSNLSADFWSGVIVGSFGFFFLAFALLAGVRIGMSAKSSPGEGEEPR